MAEQVFPEPTVGTFIFNKVGELLLLKSHKWPGKYVVPGGHVEFEEDASTALKREIKEETGADVANTQFIGAWENFFLQKHEVNLVFEANLASPDIKNLEDHIETMWVPLEEFKKARVLPVGLQDKVVQWMGDREVFFGEEKDARRFV